MNVTVRKGKRKFYVLPSDRCDVSFQIKDFRLNFRAMVFT